VVRQTLNGLEILVVDKDERVRLGLDRLFREIGFLVTAVGDPERARDQLANKFFPAAIFDFDTPVPAGGLELVAFAKERSPLTARIVMSAARTFDAAAESFRAGADDVVTKSQDAVVYLRDRVARSCSEVSAKVTRDHLLVKMANAHEEFLSRLMDMQRKLVDLEDQVRGPTAEEASHPAGGQGVDLLWVDDSSELPTALAPLLTADRGWRIRVTQSGGEALDATSQVLPHIAVIKENLPDLPASMVVNAIKRASADAVVVLYRPPQAQISGDVKLVEGSRLVPLLAAFTEANQLGRALVEIRDGMRKKQSERRYLKAFRRENLSFLSRYNRLRDELRAAGVIVPDAE